MLAVMGEHGERRRHRHRKFGDGRDALSWASYLVLLVQRHYHWAVLLLVLLAIMTIGMGAPLLPIDGWNSFWQQFL